MASDTAGRSHKLTWEARSALVKIRSQPCLWHCNENTDSASPEQERGGLCVFGPFTSSVSTHQSSLIDCHHHNFFFFLVCSEVFYWFHNLTFILKIIYLLFVAMTFKGEIRLKDKSLFSVFFILVIEIASPQYQC